MNDTELRAQLKRALGRDVASVAELRLTNILGGVLASGGEPAERTLVLACDLYARMQERGQLGAVPPPRPARPGG